jgi:L-rhamnose mutarotase
MTKILLIATAVMASTTLFAAEGSARGTKDSPVYEMRVYYSPQGKLDDLHARFRDHTMALFEKHGITNFGYFVPIDNKENKLIYFLSYPSREAREKSWKEFFADPDWQKAWKESEKNGKLVEKVETAFLQLTDYSPIPQPKKGAHERVFELRTYTTPEGKLGDLNARFRDHTMALFKKHGMENIVYWVKMPDQKDAATTLVYLLAHKSQDAAKESFDAFRKDPDWVKARTESEKGGPLTVQNGVKSEFLKPTDYSPMK